MSLNVLLNGLRGSGKSTVVRNISSYYTLPEGRKWIFFDRGNRTDSRNNIVARIKTGSVFETKTLDDFLIRTVLKVRAALEARKYNTLLEYFMFLAFPVYSISQNRLVKESHPDITLTALPVFIRNLRKLSTFSHKIGLNKHVMNLMGFPANYKVIVNLLITPKESLKRAIRREQSNFDKAYYEYRALSDSAFLKEFMSRRKGAINLDAFRVSDDVAAEIIGSLEVILAVKKTLIDESAIISKDIQVLPVTPLVARIGLSLGFDKTKELVEVTELLEKCLGYHKDVRLIQDSREVLQRAKYTLGTNRSLWFKQGLYISRESIRRQLRFGSDLSPLELLTCWIDYSYALLTTPVTILSAHQTFDEKARLHTGALYMFVAETLSEEVFMLEQGNFRNFERGMLDYTISTLLWEDSLTKKDRRFIRDSFGEKLSASAQKRLKMLVDNSGLLDKHKNISNKLCAIAVLQLLPS